MSESDNSDILADIRALDAALALTANNKSAVDLQTDALSSPNDDECSDSDDDYINSNLDVDESENAYEINKKLIRGLLIAKKKLTALLQGCEQKIERLNERIKMCTDESSERGRLLTTAGIPYFKDKDCFSAPKNYDTKLKETRGELLLLCLMKKPCRWSSNDRGILLRAIHNEAIESVLSGNFNKADDSSSGQAGALINNKEVLPRNFTEMVGKIGEREFDWYKISATDFEEKHTPNECRTMWNIYLHPDINKDEWTSTEDNQLLRCIREYKYQNWDDITVKLNTKRSAYQCFIRYNTIKKMPFVRRFWSKQEDRHLLRVLNRLKVGNYIPWAEVASYLQHRTKQQVYTRWKYRTLPHLIKGRFTPKETDTLQKGIRKYGTNFPKISKIMMPHRSVVQLYNHYHTVMGRTNKNVWTLEDDEKLIYLHNKYSNKWSKIALHFSTKTRIQVRHRYARLVKYLSRGFTLEDIHINSVSLKNTLVKSSNIGCNKSIQSFVQTIDIWPRLYDTLCFPPLLQKINFQGYLRQLDTTQHNTKQLYNVLNLLDANLNIPDDFSNNTHLTREEKLLSIFFRNYISEKDNSIKNNEVVEKFRFQMFGAIPHIDEKSRFIPPPPFDGYTRKKNVKETKSINCNLDFSEKFFIDVPMEMVTCYNINSFLTVEEEIQFYKFSQLLISDVYNYDKQSINLHRSSQRRFPSDTKNARYLSNSYGESSMNSKTRLGKREIKTENSKTSQKTNIEHNNEDANKTPDVLSDIISPNHATLLGLKNLLLWKLLYEYQSKNLSTENMHTIATASPEYQEAYQILKTRLLQLFKLPIGLSNTTLLVQGTEAIFAEQQDIKENELAKRKKPENVDSMKPKKKVKLNIPIDNILQDTNSKTADHPTTSKTTFIKCEVK